MYLISTWEKKIWSQNFLFHFLGLTLPNIKHMKFINDVPPPKIKKEFQVPHGHSILTRFSFHKRPPLLSHSPALDLPAWGHFLECQAVIDFRRCANKLQSTLSHCSDTLSYGPGSGLTNKMPKAWGPNYLLRKKQCHLQIRTEYKLTKPWLALWESRRLITTFVIVHLQFGLITNFLCYFFLRISLHLNYATPSAVLESFTHVFIDYIATPKPGRAILKAGPLSCLTYLIPYCVTLPPIKVLGPCF